MHECCERNALLLQNDGLNDRAGPADVGRRLCCVYFLWPLAAGLPTAKSISLAPQAQKIMFLWLCAPICLPCVKGLLHVQVQ